MDDQGRARMVDVSGKNISVRRAVFESYVRLNPDTFKLVAENRISKGDVFSTARIAGIMAAKKTAEIIPLCHTLFLSFIDVGFDMRQSDFSIRVWAEARTASQTGVEMEALVAVQTACMTIYDMCKAVQRDIQIDSCVLVHKSGGRSGNYNRPD
ncbi:MAG: cyclic pyranopterin monophosphate synthase MoaC [Thermodesulfobacteriota bacterium]